MQRPFRDLAREISAWESCIAGTERIEVQSGGRDETRSGSVKMKDKGELHDLVRAEISEEVETL